MLIFTLLLVVLGALLYEWLTKEFDKHEQTRDQLSNNKNI